MHLEDGIDEGVLRGEAPIQRADTDTGPRGDVLDTGVDTALREGLPGSLEYALAVLLSVTSKGSTSGVGISGGYDPLMVAWAG